MPVPADGWVQFLGLWGLASLAVAAAFSVVMRATDGPTPPAHRAEEPPCECLGCLHLRRSA